uniref:Reverse transcriptase domain-containing protein n=1 Tax=Nicotiana tabacum TaxID=4097 RepID=A0A1S4BM98_TOBAC|nr:PREDICTED: uncharacterized protein LOC107809777 [Nicotiana tabacum]
MNKPFKQREMGNYLKKHRIKLAGILVTRVKAAKFTNSLAKIAKGWKFAHNYAHAVNGRIWLIWHDAAVNVSILDIHGEYIHCKVVDRKSNFKCVMTVIYGKNTIAERRDLWAGLLRVGSVINEPWCICGDFNTPLHTTDKTGGQPVTEYETREFQKVLNSLNLTDMKASGRFYTWTNRHVWSRIDRALCNAPWIMEFDIGLMEKEKEALDELNKWSDIQEKILKQKAKAHWINAGDGNNRYFFACMKARASSNNISVLKGGDGRVLQKHDDIKDEILQFYKGLLGSTANRVPCIDLNIMRQGPSLTMQQQRDMCSEITQEEIKAALFNIDDNKAPGIDGFNALFFKKAWPIVREDVCDAVQEFFQRCKMLRAVNNTVVTLVPKSTHPKTARDFRPIACYSTLYKIISKIISGRIKGVIDEIVGHSQSAFIPGRLISDNIILSHELVKGYTRKHISPRCMIKVDLQKAYDSVEWYFIEQMLKELGFPGKMVCLGTLKDEPEFNFHPRCQKLGITHLCFADDLLLFARGDTKSVQMLRDRFALFSEASGLKANLNKSQVYFGGVDEDTRMNILNLLGRLQLIKAVLFGVKAYWSQLFLLPRKVIKLIEATCRSYLWTGCYMQVVLGSKTTQGEIMDHMGTYILYKETGSIHYGGAKSGFMDGCAKLDEVAKNHLELGIGVAMGF